MKTLDKSRPYSIVYGQAAHAYEQDGIAFDRKGYPVDAGFPKAAGELPTATAPADGKPPEGDPNLPPPPSTNIPSLGLATKVENALLGAGIQTVDQLCLATKEELIALPNIGEAAVKDIVKKLKAADKKLAG